MYAGILFGLSTLVRLVRPCSMYVCILLVRLVRLFYSALVRPCSMYAGILFGLCTLVRLVRPCSHVCWYSLFSLQVLCMWVFFSVLVR